MKLFYSIALAIVPVLATASIVFVSYAEGGVKLVKPDKSGLVAFGIVVLGAMLQIGKEVSDWREEKEKEQRARDEREAANRRAISGLEGICRTVNFMLQWMAAESKVAYPCQENEIPDWFYVHNMYRTNLINHWASRKVYWLNHLEADYDTGHERQNRVIGILDSWRKQLNRDIRDLDLGNDQVKPYASMIRTIEGELDSNWGLNELPPSDRNNPKAIMQRISQAIQEVVNVAEFVYPGLRREEYSAGRQRCAEIQSQRYPERHYTDLVFLTNDDLPHEPGTPFP